MPKQIPFEFVLEYLSRLEPRVKPMFGCHAIYVGEKIVLILRSRTDHEYDNGVWVSTTHEHHDSLRKELPSMRSILIFGPGESGWQVIPEEADSFESEAIHVCELILHGDIRIGSIPERKAKKKKL